jgi:hypothetical protein
MTTKRPAHAANSQPEKGSFPPSAPLLEQMADGLAALLVAEWKARHSQRVSDGTVKSPGGFDHADA